MPGQISNDRSLATKNGGSHVHPQLDRRLQGFKFSAEYALSLPLSPRFVRAPSLSLAQGSSDCFWERIFARIFLAETVPNPLKIATAAQSDGYFEGGNIRISVLA